MEGEGLDAVRLMTIHRAKGLEFPVVVVADLGRSPRPPSEIAARGGRRAARAAPGPGRRRRARVGAGLQRARRRERGRRGGRGAAAVLRRHDPGAGAADPQRRGQVRRLSSPAARTAAGRSRGSRPPSSPSWRRARGRGGEVDADGARIAVRIGRPEDVTDVAAEHAPGRRSPRRAAVAAGAAPRPPPLRRARGPPAAPPAAPAGVAGGHPQLLVPGRVRPLRLPVLRRARARAARSAGRPARRPAARRPSSPAAAPPTAACCSTPARAPGLPPAGVPPATPSWRRPPRPACPGARPRGGDELAALVRRFAGSELCAGWAGPPTPGARSGSRSRWTGPDDPLVVGATRRARREGDRARRCRALVVDYKSDRLAGRSSGAVVPPSTPPSDSSTRWRRCAAARSGRDRLLLPGGARRSGHRHLHARPPPELEARAAAAHRWRAAAGSSRSPRRPTGPSAAAVRPRAACARGRWDDPARLARPPVLTALGRWAARLRS